MPDSLSATFGGTPNRRSSGLPDSNDPFGDDTLSRRETLELVRAYYRITDPSVRKRVFDLIKSMGPNESS
jgi:hypothetical protein